MHMYIYICLRQTIFNLVNAQFLHSTCVYACACTNSCFLVLLSQSSAGCLKMTITLTRRHEALLNVKSRHIFSHWLLWPQCLITEGNLKSVSLWSNLPPLEWCVICYAEKYFPSAAWTIASLPSPPCWPLLSAVPFSELTGRSTSADISLFLRCSCSLLFVHILFSCYGHISIHPCMKLWWILTKPH